MSLAQTAMRSLCAPLILAGLTILAYSNSFAAGFTLDSAAAILNDPRVREATARNISDIFSHTYWWPADSSGLYRPLTTLSYLFNYAVLGNAGSPAAYHFFNLLLHLANVLLVYAIARRVTRYAFAAALLWAAHPLLTESVTNLVGRADLLAALGVLGAIWFYIERPRWWPFGVMLATAVGVFSKESAIVIPALLPLFDRRRRNLVIGLGAAALPIGAMLLARGAVLSDALPRSVPFTDNPLIGADFVTAQLAALGVLGRYCLLLFWPASLSADYSYAQIPAAIDWPFVAIALVVAVAGAVWSRRALLWAAITILPVSNLLFPIGTIMAERFLYLPAIAFAVCLAALWRWRAGQVAVCAIALAFAARSWTRNLDWRDDRTMAESLIRTAPASFKSHRLLAATDPSRATAEIQKALAILEPLPDIRNSEDTWRFAGEQFARAGDYTRSAEALERCLRIVEAKRPFAGGAVYPATGAVLDRLASDYLALHRPDDAAVVLMAGQLTTGNPAFRARLLDLYRNSDGAVVPGPNGPALNPQSPTVHRHLCAAMLRAGKTADLATYGCKP